MAKRGKGKPRDLVAADRAAYAAERALADEMARAADLAGRWDVSGEASGRRWRGRAQLDHDPTYGGGEPGELGWLVALVREGAGAKESWKGDCHLDGQDLVLRATPDPQAPGAPAGAVLEARLALDPDRRHLRGEFTVKGTAGSVAAKGRESFRRRLRAADRLEEALAEAERSVDALEDPWAAGRKGLLARTSTEKARYPAPAAGRPVRIAAFVTVSNRGPAEASLRLPAGDVVRFEAASVAGGPIPLRAVRAAFSGWGEEVKLAPYARRRFDAEIDLPSGAGGQVRLRGALLSDPPLAAETAFEVG